MRKKFDEIFEDCTKLGTKIRTDEYHPNGKHPIIDQGQEMVAGFTDLEDGLFDAVPAIVFGDHTRIIKYVDYPFFLGADGVKVLRSKVPDANYRYLYYALENARIPNTGYNRHYKWLKELEIEYPPISQQIKTVKVLDEVESIIHNRQNQLQKLDELVKARFVELFGDPVANEKGWHVELLKDVCNGIGDGLHGTPEYDEVGAYPFINGNNLTNGTIEITPSTRMVNTETYINHYIEISDNAILLSINGTLGKLALYNREKVMLGKSACYCNLRPEINREFVYGVMRTNAFAEFLERNATASTIKNVGLKAIRNFRLIVPPDDLQTEFVTFSRRVDKSKVVA